MSQSSDNAAFAGIVQSHLASTGHYKGPLDKWAGIGTQKAFADFIAGVVPAEPPTEPVVPAVPSLAGTFTLPKEGTNSLNAFYGTAQRNADYITKFSFPSTHMRLYNRTGAQIKIAEGDQFPKHSCHKAIKERLEAAYRELYATLGQERCEREGWHVYSGCYNYRVKVGGSSLSTHSWAIAIDINDSENPYSQRSTTFSDLGIDIMERNGFLSGGRAWGKDWMHFQAAIPFLSSGSYYAKNGLPKNIKAA